MTEAEERKLMEAVKDKALAVVGRWFLAYGMGLVIGVAGLVTWGRSVEFRLQRLEDRDTEQVKAMVEIEKELRAIRGRLDVIARNQVLIGSKVGAPIESIPRDEP